MGTDTLLVWHSYFPSISDRHKHHLTLLLSLTEAMSPVSFTLCQEGSVDLQNIITHPDMVISFEQGLFTALLCTTFSHVHVY